MEGMRFLRENRVLIYAALTLPLFFLYLDRAIMLYLNAFKSFHSEIHSFLITLDPVVNILYYGFVVLVVIFVIGGRFLKRDLWRILITGVIVTGMAVQIKHLIGRARPKLGYDAVFTGPSFKYVYSSFPSEHTAFVFMLTSILSNYYPKYRILFYSLATWIGFERIEDSAHFPSDVLAGALLGLIIGRFLIYKIEKQRRS